MRSVKGTQGQDLQRKKPDYGNNRGLRNDKTCLPDETIAIIPARGGSVGIPRKNIRDLGGHPLLAYSICAALSAGNIDRVIVSTDDVAVADIARQYGAEVPFLRPTSISGDKALINEALHFTITQLYGSMPKALKTIVLYPTSPFRTPGLVNWLTEKLQSGFSSVLTVKPIAVPSGDYLYRNGRNWVTVPTAGEGRLSRPYGIFSGFSNAYPARNYVHMVKDELALIDIDMPEDLELAREVVRRGFFDVDALFSKAKAGQELPEQALARTAF